jgi:hypothetical protein
VRIIVNLINDETGTAHPDCRLLESEAVLPDLGVIHGGQGTRVKFVHPREKRRTTSDRRTSWPPSRTLAAIRLSASRLDCSFRYTISIRYPARFQPRIRRTCPNPLNVVSNAKSACSSKLNRKSACAYPSPWRHRLPGRRTRQRLDGRGPGVSFPSVGAQLLEHHRGHTMGHSNYSVAFHFPIYNKRLLSSPRGNR